VCVLGLVPLEKLRSGDEMVEAKDPTISKTLKEI
jgi:hypothetical protein